VLGLDQIDADRVYRTFNVQDFEAVRNDEG
jgi:hypothetical protein